MDMNWRRYLEIIGPQLFLRYRKRLMQPGISWEVWRAYPGASLPDVWLRVHAGRQLIRNGDAFAALAWVRCARRSTDDITDGEVAGPTGASDREGRASVRFGAAAFGLFCGLTLAGMLTGDAVWPALLGGAIGALTMLMVSARGGGKQGRSPALPGSRLGHV